MTLIEVLAAIFILGVGMLAVLVLYPLGALKMAKALQDGRCGTIAQNADAAAIALDLRSDPAVVGVIGPNFSPDPATYAPSDPSGFSYPVFIDPYYALFYTSVGTPAVQRVASGMGATPTLADRWFALLDDHVFAPNGEPIQSQRGGRYTWTYMLKRIRSSEAQTTECTVIVYAGRPITQPILEDAYDVSSPDSTAVGTTNIVLRYAVGGPVGTVIQEKPALRRGGWMFDATYKTRNRGAAANGYVHAEFYKVMEALDDADYTDPVTAISYKQVRVEVQPPLRDAFVQRMVVLEGAVEVFERGNGRR